jgi:hypothetical protein
VDWYIVVITASGLKIKPENNVIQRHEKKIEELDLVNL